MKGKFADPINPTTEECAEFDEYLAELYREQHGKCAVCQERFALADMRPERDHLGGFNALTCDDCRLLIMSSCRDIKWLRQAVRYLQTHG